MTLEGRTALITSGGRGIGKGIAVVMAEAGADVGIVYRRDEDAARQTVTEIESFGRKAAIFNEHASTDRCWLLTVAKFCESVINTDHPRLGNRDVAVV